MDSARYNKSQIIEKAEAYHDKMSKLFKENRFLFELERKKVIQRTIKSARNEHVRSDLEKLQEKWDRILNNSVSGHNRFVLIQMLLWEHVRNEWLPALKFNR